MKKLLISTILIAVILLAGPKIIGNSVNQNLNDFINNLNEIPGYQLKIKNLESGWFSTNAEVNVGFDTALFNDGSMNLAEELRMKQLLNANFNITAQHGPLLTLNGFGLGLFAFTIEVDDPSFREYLEYPENQSLYSVKGRTSLFGATSFIDTMPSFTVVDFANFRFDGWNGKGKASSNKTAYQGEMPSLVFTEQNEGLEVTSLTFNFDYDTSISDGMTNMFVDSKGEFNVGSVRYLDSTMDDESFNLKNFGVSVLSQVNKNEDLIDYAVNYSMEAMSVATFNVNDIVFNVELKNLEKNLIDLLEELSYKNSLETEQVMLDLLEQDIEETKKFMLPILQASPEFNVTQMSGNIGSGNFSGYFKTKLTDIENLPNDPYEDITWWLSKVVIDYKLTFDKSMAREMDNIFELGSEAMIEQGMLPKNSDGGFDLIFRLQDGLATLNDEPFPLPF
jgi:uncharacterized protein YdgA (DUF945 family)